MLLRAALRRWRQEVEAHPWLLSELEASLSSIKPCLKNKIIK